VAAVLLTRSVDGTTQSGEKATAFIGDLASSATASGRVQAGREASLALTGSGRVEAVTVEIGDLVEAGEALLILEDDALQRAVLQAEEALAIQEANLESLEAGATAAEVEAAQAAVTSAKLALEALLAGPTDEEIAQAEANLHAAQANVAAASNRLGETQAGPDEAALLQAQQAVADAEQAVLDAERAHQRMLARGAGAGEPGGGPGRPAERPAGRQPEYCGCLSGQRRLYGGAARRSPGPA